MIKEGTEVEWKWGNGKASGKVIEIFKEEVTKTIDGNKVTREASSDKPAYYIEQDDNQKVLKSSTEVSRKDS